MTDDRDYWFPAKRYGWGWGAPRTWQGWVTMVVYIALMTAGAFVFDLRSQQWLFLLFVGAITAVLLFICWRTGEPPRWRWGDE
jgi:hypothetical protein